MVALFSFRAAVVVEGSGRRAFMFLAGSLEVVRFMIKVVCGIVRFMIKVVCDCTVYD